LNSKNTQEITENEDNPDMFIDSNNILKENLQEIKRDGIGFLMNEKRR
jgi:hypothetical protein